MSEITTPTTMKARIIEIRCTCGRRVCDARLTGNSLVRLRCPRCGKLVQATAEMHKAEPVGLVDKSSKAV